MQISNKEFFSMKKFSIRRTEFHIMHRVNQYEFDVTDQEQWNLLKSGLNRDDLPKVAPEDPEIWGSLICWRLDDLSIPKDDVISMRDGGYQVMTELLNAAGEIIGEVDEDGNL
jgi:hypothetical protein